MPTGVEREADAVETVGGEVGHQSSGVRSHHTERRVERGHVLQDHLLGRCRLSQASDLICWMEGDMSMYLFSASLAMLQSFSSLQFGHMHTLYSRIAPFTELFFFFFFF